MRKLMAVLVVMIFSSSMGLAQSSNGSNNGVGNRGVGNGNGNGNGNANGNNNGNGNGNGNSSSAAIMYRYPQNTPSVFAPGLNAAGIESCLGSSSMGGSVAGFGVSFGSTVEDRGCQLRLYARTLYALGYKRAATRILCNDPQVMLALSYEGVSCGVDDELSLGEAAPPRRRRPQLQKK